jgi:hypothetical protein
MNAIPDSAGTTKNLVEFRFIAVSISSYDYLSSWMRAARASFPRLTRRQVLVYEDLRRLH